MTQKYRVGITRDILDSLGEPAFGRKALEILDGARDIEWEYLPEIVRELTPDHAARYDALYVNMARTPASAVARGDHRLRVVARHGVGYDSSFMDDVFPYFHPPSGGVGAAPAGQVLELPIHWTLDDWSYSMVSPYAFPAGHANPIRRSAEIVEIWTDDGPGS